MSISAADNPHKNSFMPEPETIWPRGLSHVPGRAQPATDIFGVTYTNKEVMQWNDYINAMNKRIATQELKDREASQKRQKGSDPRGMGFGTPRPPPIPWDGGNNPMQIYRQGIQFAQSTLNETLEYEFQLPFATSINGTSTICELLTFEIMWNATEVEGNSKVWTKSHLLFINNNQPNGTFLDCNTISIDTHQARYIFIVAPQAGGEYQLLSSYLKYDLTNGGIGFFASKNPTLRIFSSNLSGFERLTGSARLTFRQMICAAPFAKSLLGKQAAL